MAKFNFFAQNEYQGTRPVSSLHTTEPVIQPVNSYIPPVQIPQPLPSIPLPFLNIAGQTRLTNGVLISPNFKSGETGWAIDAEGNAEFNNGTFRGTLTATTIDIGGSDATSFHVDINGNMWLGASTFASAPFKVSNAGVLSATKRVVTVTQSATPAVNTDITDVASITGLAQDITSMTTNLTGTPSAGQLIIIQITDNGTARAITWGASFASTLVALPTSTTISTLLRVGFQWNSTTSKWDCIALA